MAALKVTVVGAPNTGKSRLTEALNGSLKASGLNALVTVSWTPVKDTAELIFLMGLESACAAGLDADQVIRTLLTHSCVAHQVLYGSPDERFGRALRVIEKRLAINSFTETFPDRLSRNPGQWTWACDKCSDPQCEHRLLSDLLARRVATGPTGL